VRAPSALAGAFTAAVAAPAEVRPPNVDVPGADWYVGINGTPTGPMPLSTLRSHAASGAVTLESLVWRDGFEQWQPLKNFPELAAILEEGVSSARASQAPLPPPVLAPAAPVRAVLAEPPATSTLRAATPTTGPAVVSDKLDLELAGLAPRRTTSPAAWIAVIVALLFGLTIGFVLFSGQKPAEPVVKYIEVPAKAPATALSPEVAAAPVAGSEPTAAPVAAGGAKPTARGGVAKSGDPKSEGEQKPIEGLKGLAGLQGGAPVSGPAATQSTTARSGEQLDSTAVQQTVSRYTSSVKRSCWQPALDTRDTNAPTSARVTVTITVGSSGSVQAVSTSGDPRGYRGLASCIAGRVRGWQFPASSGTTTVNVPFVFAAQ
jgi:hypothetical protein